MNPAPRSCRTGPDAEHVRRWDERGSAAIEAVLLAPVLAAVLLLIVFAGRVALTRQAVEAAAWDAARAASLARTADQARTAAVTMAKVSLGNQDITCTSNTVTADVSGFAIPPGQPAAVLVSVVCDLATADLALLSGIPGSIRIDATATSPLDTYRGRR